MTLIYNSTSANQSVLVLTFIFCSANLKLSTSDYIPSINDPENICESVSLSISSHELNNMLGVDGFLILMISAFLSCRESKSYI